MEIIKNDGCQAKDIYFIFLFLLLSLVNKSDFEIFCKGVLAPGFSLTAIKI